jgi:hypothetical protein
MMSGGTSSSADLMTIAENGSAAQSVTAATAASAVDPSDRNGTPWETTPLATSSALTLPSLARRNFQRLPTTIGGRVQTRIMAVWVTRVNRVWRRSARANRVPIVMVMTRTDPTKNSVCTETDQKRGSAKISAKFARPTNGHVRSRLPTSTSLRLIRRSRTSG